MKKKTFLGWLTSDKWDIWCTLGLAWICMGILFWYFELGWFAK